MINSLLSIPHLFEIQKRYGIDYSSYLNQVSAVYHGQLNYSKIIGSGGPCYYPAGHLLHYLPFFLLHSATEHAEKILKAFHILLHSAIILVVVEICYIYYAEAKVVDPEKVESSQKSG